MKAFNPTQLLSETALGSDTLNSLAGKKVSKKQLKIQAEAAYDDAVRAAKYKYYHTIMECGDSQVKIDAAKEEMNNDIDNAKTNYESTIHGIDVEADSIFDNGVDDGEFNRTEWMDLTLENAYRLDRDIKNIYLHAYVEEACVLMEYDSSFGELFAINEAILNRIKNAVKKAIEAVKRIFAKFLEKIRAIGKDHSKYLKKYKDTILQQQPKSEIIKIKDFQTAMQRIMNASVPNIQYNELKTCLDALYRDKPEATDEEAQRAVFEKIIATKLPNYNTISSKIGPNDETSDICKTYFCCSDQADLIESDMQRFNMTDIYNFLIDSTKMTNQIDKDIKSLESNANMLATAAEKEQQKQQPPVGQTPQTPKPDSQETPAEQGQGGTGAGSGSGSGNGGGGATPKKIGDSAIMSYDTGIYSAVMESVITLQEFEAVKQPQQDNSMAGRMQNVNGDNFKDQDAANQHLSQNGGGNQNTRNYVATYIKAAQTFLGAKMTSVQFFSNELFQLVRHHVGNFIQGETTQSAAQTGTL
jgi:hypothetical protein